MQLTARSLIVRAADPRVTLAELSRPAGAPRARAPTGGGSAFASGIVARRALDIEVLRDRRRRRRCSRSATASASRADVAAGGRPPPSCAGSASPPRRRSRRHRTRPQLARRCRSAALLPDPFPVPASTKAPGAIDRLTEAAAGLGHAGPAAGQGRHAASAGGSMVVVTEYAFDAAAWRAGAGDGPDVAEVDVGTGGHDLVAPPARPGLRRCACTRDGPPGVRRVVLTGTRRAVRAWRRRLRVRGLNARDRRRHGAGAA